MNVHRILIYLIAALALATTGACIEDRYTTSPSDQPRFSTDTLSLGTIFTAEPSATSRFTVYNPHSKQLSISNIYLSGPNAANFRVNVDGLSGQSFTDVDIRPNDSIFVFVEATLPATDAVEPTAVSASLNFTTNGVTRSVVLSALGQNVVRLRGEIIDTDAVLDSPLPYQIFDSLTVAPGAVLTIPAGARLCFHDKAQMLVRGTLRSEGLPGSPVVFEGDRQGNVVGDISFDIMSRQWEGVYFAPTSAANYLTETIIRNTTSGVYADGDPEADYSATPQLSLHNCRLTNSGVLVLEGIHTAVEAVGCEFSEGGAGLVYLQGGRHSFAQCTFANYYLFSAISGAAIQLTHIGTAATDDGSGLPYLSASFTNSIIYGLGADLAPADIAGLDILFNTCLFRSNGEDDANFVNCIWGEDPLFYTERQDYIFDYRLRPDSPAAFAADPELIPPTAEFDFYGLPRTPPTALGAYVFEPQI
ncbi:MAG: hypothetical protein HDS72_03510 [Bacteroidales bacterium]|nr:hypothetical protein [Bacteroidales bacterium]